MNILLINHYAGSLKHGMEYRPYYLAKEWIQAGHKVTIVSASYAHVRTEQPAVRDSYNEQTLDGIHYVWLKTPKYHANGLRRAVNIFCFVYQLYRFKKRLIEKNQPNVVIASSTHPLDIFPAHAIAVKTSARLIYEVHDLWPLSPIELGGMSRWHPFIMIVQWAENFAYKKASCVISILPKTLEHMVAHAMDSTKFHHIPNGIDVVAWNNKVGDLPKEHRTLIAKLKSQGQFLVGYTGAHGIANALEHLINVAIAFKDKSVTILLVGQGSEKDKLQEKARSLNLTNVIFLPLVDKATIAELLAGMDALFIGLKRMPLFRFGVSPNKLMDYMMAGVPIISAIEAGNDIVKESGCGISVSAEDANAIVHAIDEIMALGVENRKLMGAKGTEYVKANHDYRVLAKRFLSIMEDNGSRKPRQGSLASQR